MAATLLGNPRPRLESIPQYDETLGPEIIGLSESAGLYLDDWQQYVLTHSMGITSEKKWSAFEVALIVSRQNGKGSILEARELAGLFMIKTDREMLHTAHESKTASKHYYRIMSLIDNTPELRKQVKSTYQSWGRESIVTIPQPTIIIGAGGKWVRRNESHILSFIARSSGSGRGFTADFIGYDEDMILNAESVSASMPSILARPNPQIWYTGSAGLKTSTQLAAIRRRGTRFEDPSPSLFFMEWSIDPHSEYCSPNCTDHDDKDAEESIAKANPGYNIRISPSGISKLKEAFSEDPVGYMREILGVGEYPAQGDAWLVIPKFKWMNTIDKSEGATLRRVAFSIDTDPERAHTAIATAGHRNSDDKTGVVIVDYKAGTHWVVDRAVQIDKERGPTVWIVDPHTAAGSFIDELERRGLRVETVNSTEVGHGCSQFYDAVMDEWLFHPPQKPLTDALAGADQRPLGGQWAWDRKNSATDISPLVAATLALWGHLKFGEAEYKVEDSIHFNVNEIIRLVKAGVYGPMDLQRLRSSGLLPDSAIKQLLESGIEVML